MENSLLSNAIADAKAVRATALANAKFALQEAFNPKLESMLSAKLQKEIADEEIPADAAPVADEAPVDDTVTDEVPVSDAPAEDEYTDDVSADSAPIEDEGEPISYDEPESDMDEAVLGQGNPDPVEQSEDLTEDTASPDYKKTTSGHKTQDPQGSKIVVKKLTGTKKEPTEKTGSKLTVKRDVASFSNDPQGQGNELSKGPSKNEKNSTGKVLEESDEEIEEDSLDEILKELESEVNQSVLDTDESSPAETSHRDACTESSPVDDEDEEINLDELLSDESTEDSEEELDEISENEKEEEKEEEEEEEDKKKLPPWLQKENKILKAENQEYRKAVGYLRDRINEVNLLNAKLLYTNRIFKSASLSKDQKIKVIEQFDLTKSVREAKLTFVNLSESLSFGATKKIVESAIPVKKKQVSTNIKAITEGLASKVIGSTKPTKAPAILTEGAEMANRFKKLAGIK